MNNLITHVSPAGLSDVEARGLSDVEARGLRRRYWTKSSNGMWHLFNVDNTIVARVYQNFITSQWCISPHATPYDTLKEAKAVAEALVAMR